MEVTIKADGSPARPLIKLMLCQVMIDAASKTLGIGEGNGREATMDEAELIAEACEESAQAVRAAAKFKAAQDAAAPDTLHPCLSKWRARIDEAEKRGRYTQDDLRDARNYDCCATAEAAQLYPELVEITGGDVSWRNAPTDAALDRLSFKFSVVVGGSKTPDFDKAREVIDSIEKRLAEIAAEKDNAKENY